MYGYGFLWSDYLCGLFMLASFKGLIMKTISPLKAIRKKCIDCSCGQSLEVKLCLVIDCPIYPFRFGKNPNRAGIGNSNIGQKKANSTHDLEANKGF